MKNEVSTKELNKKDAIDPLDKSTVVRKLTCDNYPQDMENVSIFFGASVSARSVKLIVANITERDVWWEELRKERLIQIRQI